LGLCRAKQAAEKLVPAVNLSEALECGSKLPLWLEPACWPAMMLSVAIPASQLAGRKAAASCRTPKRAAPAQAVVALSPCPGEFYRSL
jgi:hypothetical protein